MPVQQAYMRDDFLRSYVYPPAAEREFQLDGKPSVWAHENPKGWQAGELGAESDSFNFLKAIKIDAARVLGRPQRGYSSSISSDQSLLAIAADHRVLIYDIATKELRQTLDGGGDVLFTPSASVVLEPAAESGDTLRPAYTLVSGVPKERTAFREAKERLIVWELDRNGRLLDEEDAIDGDALATQAIEAIIPQLTTNHEWSEEFIATTGLHENFKNALFQAAVTHRLKDSTFIENVKPKAFSCSSDGKYFVYSEKVASAQGDDDCIENLVFYDLETNQEARRIKGFNGSVNSLRFSPDNNHIACSFVKATALHLYSVTTGDLEWVLEEYGGGVTFSPDSKFLACSKNGTFYWSQTPHDRRGLIVDVATGDVVRSFTVASTVWSRGFRTEWHPDGRQIAVSCGRLAYVVRPFDDAEGSEGQGIITQVYMPEEDGEKQNTAFFEFKRVSWWDGGRLLCLQTSEGSALIYDTETNAKELFRRFRGDEKTTSSKFYGLFKGKHGDGFYLGVHGDGTVRYWDRTVAEASDYAETTLGAGSSKGYLPATPGWWEKESEEPSDKPAYPETGKYVSVIKCAKSDKATHEGERSDWADKGASLWTAE